MDLNCGDNFILRNPQSCWDFRKMKQRLEGCKHKLCATAFCFTLKNNQQPACHSLYNLPGVGVEALTHVTDISDLIWLVITPSYSFRAFHTSELQFEVLSRERDVPLCLWMITPLHTRSHFILRHCDENNDNTNIREQRWNQHGFCFYMWEASQKVFKFWTCVTSSFLNKLIKACLSRFSYVRIRNSCRVLINGAEGVEVLTRSTDSTTAWRSKDSTLKKRERNGQKMFFDSVKLQLTAQITAIFFKSHLRLQLDLVITCDTRCFGVISPSKFRLGLGIHDWELGMLFHQKCILTVTRKWDFSREVEVDSSVHLLNGNQTFLFKYFAFCHEFCLFFHKWRRDWEPGHMWTTVACSSVSPPAVELDSNIDVSYKPSLL